MNRVLEVIATNKSDIILLNQSKCDRIELCVDIKKDGLSPSFSDILSMSKLSIKPIRVMLRIRNDFIFKETDYLMFEELVSKCRTINIEGFVFGFLDENKIDFNAMNKIINLCSGFKNTFHKASDVIIEHFSYDSINELNIATVLTQGGMSELEQNIDKLKSLNLKCEVLIGGGVNNDNFDLVNSLGHSIHVGSMVRLDNDFGQEIDLNIVNRLKDKMIKFDVQNERANKLHELQISDDILIIPNVQNAANAIIFEKAGYKALTTSSAAIAYDLGYSDGQVIDFEQYLYVIKTIIRRTKLPVSVDFERGFSEDLGQLYDNANKLLNLGVVGFDIEDGNCNNIDNPAILCEKIETLCKLRDDSNINFVINARTCCFWLNVFSSKEQMINYTINCCNEYLKAGADICFIPGVIDYETIDILTSNINGLVNTIYNPQSFDLSKLERLNVSRFSLGSSVARFGYEKTIKLAKDIQSNNFEQLLEVKFSYNDANEFFCDE